MKKLMTVVIGMALFVASATAMAWDGVYRQVPINQQELRVVNGFHYYGRNPTADMYFVVQRFGKSVVMEQLQVKEREPDMYPMEGESWGAFSGVATGKWVDNFRMVISDGSYNAQAILEEESSTELTLYMYWCNQRTITVDTYTEVEDDWERKYRQDVEDTYYTKSSKTVKTGCYVPSRQYIKLVKIN